MKKMSDSNSGNKYDQANKRINGAKKVGGALSGILIAGTVIVKKGIPLVKKIIFKA